MLGPDRQRAAGSASNSRQFSTLELGYRRLCQLNQLSEFVPEVTDATCWESGVVKRLGRALFLVMEGSACSTPTAKGGLDQLGCRSPSGTIKSVISSGANVLIAVFERAACCSVESAGGVG